MVDWALDTNRGKQQPSEVAGTAAHACSLESGSTAGIGEKGPITMDYQQSRHRSPSQNIRDAEEVVLKRQRLAAQQRRGNLESKRQLEQEAQDAALRKAEQMKNITAKDLKAMSPEEIVKAYDEGLIHHLLIKESTAENTAEELPENGGQVAPEGDQDGDEEEENGSQELKPVSPEDLAKMTPAEIVKAYDEGRFTPKQPSK